MSFKVGVLVIAKIHVMNECIISDDSLCHHLRNQRWCQCTQTTYLSGDLIGVYNVEAILCEDIADCALSGGDAPCKTNDLELWAKDNSQYFEDVDDQLYEEGDLKHVEEDQEVHAVDQHKQSLGTTLVLRL